MKKSELATFHFTEIFRADIHKLRASQLLLTIASVGLIAYFIWGGFPKPEWWALSLAMYFLSGCCGVTATLHRSLSHQSFILPKWLEYLNTMFAGLGGTSSSVAWVGMHRQHHRFPDSPMDPHAPSNGTFSVLTSGYRLNESYRWAVRDLVRDRFHLYFHLYYYLILAVWISFLSILGFEFLVFGFIFPATAQVWASTITNWADHGHGYRNFDTPDHSTNAWWSAWFNWGEAWHNNHHAFPKDWNCQKRWWEIDVTALYIRFLLFVGLAKVPQH